MFVSKGIHITATALLMMFCAFAFGYPPGPAAEGDDAAKAYNRAYNLVLDEKWAEAEKAFQNVTRQHPNSAYIDDSSFWICFAKQKQRKLEDSVKCYESFIEQNPKSEWADDAQGNLINVATALAKAGMPQYGVHIKDMGKHGPDEVRLHVFDRAFPRARDRGAFMPYNFSREHV